MLFSGLTTYAATRRWQYIYPVWSRRAQGISIGINLHPNQHCNWHCIYCQVPGLQRGPSPVIAIQSFKRELEDCLGWISQEIAAHGKGDMRTLVQDIAFAGDGEPTTSPQFAEVMLLVGELLGQRRPDEKPQRIRLITNGSQLQHGHVQFAVKQLQVMEGEVWFKLDAGNDAEMQAVNGSHVSLALHLTRLDTSCSLCRTWVQTALLNRCVNHQIVTTPSMHGYLQALRPLQDKIAGILLYGIARPSQQDETGLIQAMPEVLLQDYADQLRAEGFNVREFH